MYEVIFDQAPAYELVASLYAYINKKLYKELDLGREWVKTTQAKLSPSMVAQLEEMDCCKLMRELPLLLWRCPEERTPEKFLTWLEAQSPGDLFELLAPWMDACPSDIGSVRDQILSLLISWHEQYFRHIDPAVFDGLKRDKQEKSRLISQAAGPEIVEEASVGLYLRPTERLQQVVLVPQYHCSPAILVEDYGRVITLMYPSDAYLVEEGTPSRSLLRLTRCLADESRLRILRFLAVQSRTFTEIVQHTGLAKSTVFYHMIMLRGAGLVRAYAEGETIQEYSLRTEGLKQLEAQLVSFLRI